TQRDTRVGRNPAPTWLARPRRHRRRGDDTDRRRLPGARRDQPQAPGRAARRAARAQRPRIRPHLAPPRRGDRRRHPGQQVVLDRLLDWMLVCGLREYFDRPGGAPQAWYAAQRDPVVGGALRALHTQPAAPWTVSALADRTGVSRSTLAKRFADLVCEPP